MKKHPAHKHMKEAMASMKMAAKAMTGTKGEEMKMAKMGDKKGNSMKRSSKPNESKK